MSKAKQKQITGTFLGLEGQKLLLGCKAVTDAGVRATTYELDMTDNVRAATRDLQVGLAIEGKAEYEIADNGVITKMTLFEVSAASKA